MMEKRNCENCGNEKCKRMIVAIYYDVCIETNYAAFWRPKKGALPEPPKEEK